MSEQSIQPDDPLFLVSKALDGDLPAEERQRLEQALTASPELRSEVENLRATDRLIKRWGDADVELDWTNHRKLIRARVEAAAEEEDLVKVDDLLHRLADDPATFDEAAFTGAVMAGIRTHERETSYRNLIFRIGAPLAAAAAVAIAVGGWFWSQSRRETVLPSGTPVQQVVVLFDRTPIARITDDAGDEGISLLMLGAAPTQQPMEDLPPL